MELRLDSINGLMIDKKEHEKFCHHHNVCTCGNSQFNEALAQQGKRKIGMNREKLAIKLAQHRGGHSGFPPASWDYDLADVLRSHLNELIESVAASAPEVAG